MEFLTPSLIFILLAILVLFVYVVLNFLIFYHLIRFGIGTQPKKIGIVFIAGSMMLFCINALFFLVVDFSLIPEQLGKVFGGIFTLTHL